MSYTSLKEWQTIVLVSIVWGRQIFISQVVLFLGDVFLQQKLDDMFLKREVSSLLAGLVLLQILLVL